MFKKVSKPGAATTEIAIGTALAVAAVIVGMGLFNNNLAGMVTSSGLTPFSKGKNEKTEYTALNKDYSGSQINVQITGSQGLGVLRQIANNKAITQIGNAFSGTDAGATNANSIGYLALAIKAIVGNSDICTYMTKDSDKFCDEDKIGGYSYKIDSGSSALTINKVDEKGSTIGKTKILTMGNELSSVLSSAAITPGSNGRSSLSTDKKYEFIRNLSTKSEPYVYSHVILIRLVDTSLVNTFKSNQKTTDVAPLLNNLLNELKTSLHNAHEGCAAHFIGDLNFSKGGEGCTSLSTHGIGLGSNIGFVSKQEVSEFSSWSDIISNNIKSSGSKDASDMINVMLKNGNINRIVEILKNDHKNNPTSCDIFTNGLKGIINSHNLNLSIPECNPNDV